MSVQNSSSCRPGRYFSPIPVPKIPATTVSSNKFRWLHQEAWGESFFDYFAANRSQVPQLIFRAPAFVIARKRPKSATGRWILSGLQDERPLCWAEAQLFTTNFSNIYLFFGQSQVLQYERHDATAIEDSIAAFSLLVSSLFITTSADTVSLTLDNAGDRPALLDRLAPDWGEKVEVFTYPAFSWRNPAVRLTRVTFIRASQLSWQKSSMWERDARELAWLRKRILGEVAPERLRQSFLLRFFKGLRGLMRN